MLQSFLSSKELKIILITLLLLAGFGLYFIPDSANYLFCFLLYAFASFTKYWNPREDIYSRLIIGFGAFLSISFLYSFLVNKQNFVTCFVHGYLYYGLFFYFILSKFKLDYRSCEKCLLVISVLFCFSYILQYIIYPTIIFKGATTETMINDDHFRMRMPASMCCYILYFYSLNRFLQNRKVLYLFVLVFAFIPILIMGFRSLIVATLVSSFAMVLFVSKSSKTYLFFSIIASIVIVWASQTELVQTKLAEMMHRQETDNFENSDYVRFISLKFFWNYFDSPLDKLLGGGIPFDQNTSYYWDIRNAAEWFGLFWEDLGIIGWYMVIGLPAIAIIIYIYWYCILKCKSPKLQYIRFSMFVVFVSSIFTSKELYRPGNLIILAFLLYLHYRSELELNEKKS